jgi:hypothetical protein
MEFAVEAQALLGLSLEGELKIRVMASDFDTTLAVLKELENQLPDDTSMAQINIKMGDGSADWYATHGAFGYSILVTNLSNRLNANVLAYGLIRHLCSPRQLFLRQDDSDR